MNARGARMDNECGAVGSPRLFIVHPLSFMP
jgi:hypothetical protein